MLRRASWRGRRVQNRSTRPTGRGFARTGRNVFRRGGAERQTTALVSRIVAMIAKGRSTWIDSRRSLHRAAAAELRSRSAATSSAARRTRISTRSSERAAWPRPGGRSGDDSDDPRLCRYHATHVSDRSGTAARLPVLMTSRLTGIRRAIPRVAVGRDSLRHSGERAAPRGCASRIAAWFELENLRIWPKRSKNRAICSTREQAASRSSTGSGADCSTACERCPRAAAYFSYANLSEADR